MEKRITEKGPVLNQKGSPCAGYSTKSILEYSRKAIKAPPWRIKEWDFYQVTDGAVCLQFTIGHASYAGQIGLMLFDFREGRLLAEKNKFLVLPFNSLHMPENAEADGELAYEKGGVSLSFCTRGEERRLCCKWDDFSAEVLLRRESPHSLVINIPFQEYAHAFYYNHKINCMTAGGTVSYNGYTHRFDPADSFGLLDWGRGVWPFHNEWYWSSGSGWLDGKMFGFNLGCGFGDTRAATENILFYGGEAHKLGPVDFLLDKSDYMAPWTLRDREGRLELTLTPSFDRTTKTKLLWVDNCCHQMFGDFSGRALLDDGRELKIDNIVSFAEHAVNNW